MFLVAARRLLWGSAPPALRGRSPGFAIFAKAQHRWQGAAIALALFAGACADPGRSALDHVISGTDALIVLAERRARGELDGPAMNAALAAWERTERIEIETLSVEASRALGADLRALLAARWREAAERLSKRLLDLNRDNDAPR